MEHRLYTPSATVRTVTAYYVTTDKFSISFAQSLIVTLPIPQRGINRPFGTGPIPSDKKKPISRMSMLRFAFVNCNCRRATVVSVDQSSVGEKASKAETVTISV